MQLKKIILFWLRHRSAWGRKQVSISTNILRNELEVIQTFILPVSMFRLCFPMPTSASLAILWASCPPTPSFYRWTLDKHHSSTGTHVFISKTPSLREPGHQMTLVTVTPNRSPRNAFLTPPISTMTKFVKLYGSYGNQGKQMWF